MKYNLLHATDSSGHCPWSYLHSVVACVSFVLEGQVVVHCKRCWFPLLALRVFAASRLRRKLTILIVWVDHVVW